ncbi:ricin-type beta-trefoil lectin domain protein [Thalassomonas viridans]|uniref:Ricin-type beta-trefoil lectin domain protein n=1 Tax=Thalassomonas viridans TaxID=137584 RepID=A0AAE9Z9T5_9GAMM|nr:ricin-type beta-trefoil lectin domain protein [Thalassomonas viridans]WDE08739.1 ricin-type beta-trefoil lectin domain protein [Thalassomonas viridans]
MKKNLLTVSLLCALSANANAELPVNYILAQSLSGTALFNESCYLKLTPNQEKITLPLSCQDYVLLDQTDIASEQRMAITGEVTVLGFESPFILITQPQIKDKEVISLYETFDEKDIVSQITAQRAIKKEKEESLSGKAFSTALTAPVQYQEEPPKPYHTKVVRQTIPLNRTVNADGSEQAVFEYEIDFFASQAFYNELGNSDYDNKKYVRVTLKNGPGVNFNTIEGYGSPYDSWWPVSPNQKIYYKYRDYLDRVKVSSVLSGNTVEINEARPNNNDRNLSKVTYESSVNVGFGVSIPKVPINEITVSSQKSVTYESGDFFDFIANNDANSFSVDYFNSSYGSEVNPRADGYCDLIDDASGCWKHATSTYDDPFNLYKLNGTPYSNGFVPNYLVTYAVPRSTTGSADLILNASVDGMALYGHARWAGGQLFYHGWKGTDEDKEFEMNTYTKSTRIGINWDSPLFSGAQPVVLNAVHGSNETAQCLTVQSNNIITTEECVDGSYNQMFYYTPDRKYIYQNDLSLCLSTAQEHLSLQTCKSVSNNYQEWYWDNTDLAARSYLYTRVDNNMLRLIDVDRQDVNGTSLLEVKELTEADSSNQFNSHNGKVILSSVEQ